MSSSDDESFLVPSQEATDAILNGIMPEEDRSSGTTTAATAAASTAARLPPLHQILDDTEHFTPFVNAAGLKRIRCRWCDKDFVHNATKVLFHVCRVKNKGVAPCLGCIPDHHMQRYLDLHHKKDTRKNQRAGKFNIILLLL